VDEMPIKRAVVPWIKCLKLNGSVTIGNNAVFHLHFFKSFKEDVMTQMLRQEIEKEVDPRDLIYLTREEAHYVAKCVATLVHNRRKKAEQYEQALENDNLVETVWSQIASAI